MDPTIAQLSDYAVSLQYSDIPSETVHECKRRLIDTLACAIGAFGAEPSKIARAIARRTTGDQSARILGTSRTSSPELAAFATGVMVRYLDFNDQYRKVKGGGHPSDSVPAVLAMADAMQTNGKSVITAMILAYEVFCNFSEVLYFTEKGFDDATHCAFASAVGAGKILGLSKEAMAHAIALSIVPNMALRATRRGELSMWKGCAAANACRNGIFASLLAAEGLTGPLNAIEEKEGGLSSFLGPFEWEPFGGRGAPFRVGLTNLKYFPSEYHSQAPITAALQLRDNVVIEAIESVNVETYWMAWNGIGSEPEKWHPKTRETADHSLPYIVAAALLDGTIEPDTFSTTRITDARLLALMQKITVQENPEFTKAYPNLVPCRIEIRASNGQRHVADVSYPKGHAKNPMTDIEIEDKFRKMCSSFLTPSQTAAALKELWEFDKINDLRRLMDLLIVPDQS
jgi:2-methylcitrate dehydratase